MKCLVILLALSFFPWNHPPKPPLSGFYPTNFEEITTLSPTVKWGDATDPDPDDISDSLRYICQVFTEVRKGGIVNFAFDTTAPGVKRLYVTDTLIDNYLCCFRVKTLDDGGLVSEWSETQLFWTNQFNTPPEPFPLFGPEGGVKQVVAQTHFSWEITYDRDPNSSYAYSLQFAGDSLFQNNIRSLALQYANAVTIVTDSLAAYGRVYWRVLAIDDDSLVRIGGMPEGPRSLVILPPGDANSNGVFNGIDVTYLAGYLKGFNPAPDPILAGDANGNCATNGIDVVYMVAYLKGIGAAPVRPECGN